ncbi:SDR family NAD(P)-dependent oxidoreductase [Streptomyces sp. NPDC001137]|uniref:SDR family NAD(P)-dependent oxidoreductase n=1 Tax=Streptomyces sp. NPDC001137 TaxID=3154378 RepID=UPI0033326B02
MTTIAIVGAGPQLGLAIARTFGRQGFDVALISRSHDKLDGLVGTLSTEGITAAAFPADVLDRDALTQALKDATTQFGRIDVLEYSPVGGFGSTVLITPVETEPSHVQHEIEFQLYGAIAATKAVLPAMREAGTATLLYTTGAGSIDPVPQVGNVNAAAAALRNWVINLHKELDGTGIQAAHIGIDVSIGTPAVPGFPTAQPEEISPVYWELHTTKRDQAELVSWRSPSRRRATQRCGAWTVSWRTASGSKPSVTSAGVTPTSSARSCSGTKKAGPSTRSSTRSSRRGRCRSRIRRATRLRPPTPIRTDAEDSGGTSPTAVWATLGGVLVATIAGGALYLRRRSPRT